MQTFAYERPATLAEAVALLDTHDADSRVLAGGTDLVLRLRSGSEKPSVVIDIKRIADLRPGIREAAGAVTIGATTVMTDVAASPLVRRHFRALAEAAAIVGSVQIRNRATLAGNICNASPAADTAPPLLVYGATVVAAGPRGPRRIPITDFFVESGVTTLGRGELVTAIELPVPSRRSGTVHLRRTRRRGHDLASVTLCCSVDEGGVTRLAYGSVGPRPVLFVDETGTLADPKADDEAKERILEKMFAGASPSKRSMRASPEYRLAMLRVLGRRALHTAIDRLAEGRTDG
ncbi:MAG TPA: xanthine dehydrogenase family protein subunit M [Candidatus Limnocylindrales bacterium]|jgi:carbon-monoxide dehydrogenase medium subunit